MERYFAQTVVTLAESLEDDPLHRFFYREVTLARELLAQIRGDLSHLVQVCTGTLKQTNELRSLILDIAKGGVPASWQRYKSHLVSLSSWIANFAERVAQLNGVAQSQAWRDGIALGLLFAPRGFITATRQAVAHTSQCSLEQLVLQFEVNSVQKDSFAISGEPLPLFIRPACKSGQHAHILLPQVCISRELPGRSIDWPSMTALRPNSTFVPLLGLRRPLWDKPKTRQ